MSAAVSWPTSDYDAATTRLLEVTRKSARKWCELSSADLGSIKAAVASVTELLLKVRPEWRASVRADLGQELSIKLASGKLGVPGLRAAAKNWMFDFQSREKSRRQTEDGYATGTGRRYRTGDDWKPDFYPPHPDARKHDLFACSGARMMLCKGTPTTLNTVEDALIDYLDSKRRA